MTREQLQRWRKRHKLTQRELAEMVGFHPMSITKMETGQRDVSPRLVAILKNFEIKDAKKSKRT